MAPDAADRQRRAAQRTKAAGAIDSALRATTNVWMGRESSGAASVTATAVGGGKGREGDLGGEPAPTADDPSVRERSPRARCDQERRPRAPADECSPPLCRQSLQSRRTTLTRWPAGGRRSRGQDRQQSGPEGRCCGNEGCRPSPSTDAPPSRLPHAPCWPPPAAAVSPAPRRGNKPPDGRGGRRRLR